MLSNKKSSIITWMHTSHITRLNLTFIITLKDKEAWFIHIFIIKYRRTINMAIQCMAYLSFLALSIISRDRYLRITICLISISHNSTSFWIDSTHHRIVSTSILTRLNRSRLSSNFQTAKIWVSKQNSNLHDNQRSLTIQVGLPSVINSSKQDFHLPFISLFIAKTSHFLNFCSACLV